MFDFDVGKLLLIGVVALIFIPPKDLPEALRLLGRLVGQARRMATDFQSQFQEALREAELTEIHDGLNDLKQKTSMEGALSRVADMLEAPAASKTATPGATPVETTAAAQAEARAPASSGLIIVEDQPPPAPQPAAPALEAPQAGKPA
jgi:sec-independent protein translocase protein TatB